MRGRASISLLFGAISAISAVAANAADFSAGRGVGEGYGVNSSFGARIEPLIVWDSEPGVIVRSWWYAPWQNRYYFPKTGRRPKVGRLEHMTAHRPSKNEDYYRFWSVSSVFAPEPVATGGYFPGSPYQQ